jgi:hypothetical protein
MLGFFVAVDPADRSAQQLRIFCGGSTTLATEYFPSQEHLLVIKFL